MTKHCLTLQLTSTVFSNKGYLIITNSNYYTFEGIWMIDTMRLIITQNVCYLRGNTRVVWFLKFLFLREVIPQELKSIMEWIFSLSGFSKPLLSLLENENILKLKHWCEFRKVHTTCLLWSCVSWLFLNFTINGCLYKICQMQWSEPIMNNLF